VELRRAVCDASVDVLGDLPRPLQVLASPRAQALPRGTCGTFPVISRSFAFTACKRLLPPTSSTS
jgi:hypothetical protein